METLIAAFVLLLILLIIFIDVICISIAFTQEKRIWKKLFWSTTIIAVPIAGFSFYLMKTMISELMEYTIIIQY